MSITKFALAFQKAPIIFTGGIANNIPGGLLPITSITEAGHYSGGITGDSDPGDLDNYAFDFLPQPGATLADYSLGAYPFANQTTAANAIIGEPLRVALLMLAPVRDDGGYDAKLSLFQSLRSSIAQHAALGGTYTVATPSYLYTNCILAGLKDASEGDPKRPQDRWVWEFTQPLLTLEAAQQAQNALMQKASSGVRVPMNAAGGIGWSGQGPAVGNPASGIGPNVVNAAKLLAGASVSGPAPAIHGPI